MSNWFKDIVTGIDGVSYDIVRVLAVGVVVEAMAIVFWKCLIKGEPFEPQAFGLGMSAVFVAVGVALNLKKDTEPK